MGRKSHKSESYVHTCNFDSRFPSGLDAELGVPAADELPVAAGEDDADVAILGPFSMISKFKFSSVYVLQQFV